MTTSNDPDELRTEIEQTRANLSQNVNALGEAVTPGAIARRQVDKVKGAGVGVKDKIMGSAQDARSSVAGSASSSASSVGDSMSSLGESAGQVPQVARRKAQGNPLAAGLIAFGAGMLLSSLIPASEKEREAAEALKVKAEPLTTELTEAAKDMAQGLKAPAQDAMENVKATAAEATDHVKAEGQTAVDDVKYRAADAKDNVQQA